MIKTYMVPPVPMPGTLERLRLILEELGNDRAFTLIRAHGNTYRVHFAGDKNLSTVKRVDNKFVIIQD